ncbi:MAG: hypothetical protein JNJ98_07550 [Gemmatimonadetes bacterium]|nr:hypothetical protein [Gemmatimonadota bacterium]
MTALRLVILAVAMTLGTVLLHWWVVPVLAFAYGVVARDTARPAVLAMVAAAVAWGGYLAILSFGGAPVGRFGADLASAMQLPSPVPLLATLLFPAAMAGPAAYLGSRLVAGPGRVPGRR